MSLGLDPLRDVRDVGIDQYRAGLGEYLGAVASDAWANGPLSAANRLLDVAEAGATAERKGLRLLTAEEATDRGRDVGLRFEAPIAESAYQILADAKQAQIASESVFKRARLEDGYGTMKWLLAGGTEFLTLAADPLNLASAFVPVVGQARYAAMAARIGPLGATLAKGALEGAVGQALLEPITALDQSALGNEYSMLDTMMNLGFGAGLGVVLHGAGYGAGAGFRFMRSRYVLRDLEVRSSADAALAQRDARLATPDVQRVDELPPRQPVAEAMEQLRPETKDAALRTAVAQLVQDKPVDIEPVLRADPGYDAVRAEMAKAPQRPDLEELQRLSAESTRDVLPAVEPPPEWRPSPEELKQATRVARGWTPETALATPQSLVDFVRKNGGLIRDTPEAAELQASDLGRQPGLLRTRQKGRQADQMAQAAADAGYRLGKETATGSGIDVDAFVRALIEDAQGTRKHYPDNAHTTAWQVQQEYFAHYQTYLQDVLGVDPRGMDPRQLAWLLAQDRDTARLMVLLRDVDRLGPEGSLELAARLDAERAALEAQILADEPGRIEPDGPIADHRDTPAATLAELERYYADHERTAGETRQGGQAVGGEPAGGRAPEGGEAAPARPARGDDPAAGAGLRREEGEGRPAAAEPRAQDLADFAERQRAADLQADPAALAKRDERLAGEAREIQQLLADDLADFGHVLDENTRAIFDEAGKIFDDEAKAIDALASCRIGETADGLYDCLGAVMTAIGRRVTMDEFDAFYTRLDEERARLFAAGYPADWLTAAQTVAKQIEIEKAIAQRQVIRNKLVYADARAFIAAARQSVDAGRALEARLVGINAPIEGGRMSVAAEQHGLWTTSAGALLADLRRLGGNSDRLVRLFSDRGFELEIARALRGEAAHEDARLIAGAIEKVREDLRRQENDAGGWRGKLDGYVTAQSHDSLRVRRAGYEAWKARIMPMLDADRTFGRQEELLAQLRLERGQVLQHRMTAAADVAAVRQELKTANTLDKKATARGGRLDAADARLAAQVDEAARTMGDALGRYMDLAERSRQGARSAAPLLGESGTQEVTGRQLMEARVAMTRARERLQALRDQASAGRGRSIDNDLKRQDLADWIEATMGRAERAERGLELMNELDQRIAGYEQRLQGPVDPEAFLKRIYNAIAADTHITGKSDEFKGLLSQIGPGNIAKRRAAHRELHFKTADDEVAYMREFGAGGLADGVLRDIEGAATAIALMRGLGPNPEAMFNLLRSELLKEAHDTGNNRLARQVQRKSLDWQLAEITGKARGVANPTIAAWSSTIRTVQSMAKLGGAMISSFGDIPTAASELKWQGQGALDSYSAMFKGLMKGRRSGEQRVIADLLGVGFESLTGQVLARMGGESAPPGGLSRASALFFRLNGLSWWTDTHKTTAGLVIARYFAAESGKAMPELPPRMQRLMKQYGIDERDWNIMRQAAVHAAEDGTTFLTPEGIRQITIGEFATLGARIDQKGEGGLMPSERAMREARDRLAAAYGALVTDRVDFALPTGGARENAYLHMGTERGDVLGESLRFIMQFKSFAVGMATKPLGREVFGSGGGPLSATARVMWLAFQLSVFGYLSMTAKELIAGKNPRDPQSPETWLAAMLQGGGLGIYGDFFFGEFNRFGRSALATAAGPTFGTADDLLELWAKARDTGKMEKGGAKYGADLAASSLRVAASNTPFASLFWARPAINYLALYPIQEKLNPGYLQRMQRRIERENHQTFWLAPTEAPRL